MPKSIYRHEYRLLIDLLRQLREGAGISQGQVAATFQWPQSTLSHVERGSRRLDIVEFLDYCHAIGADPRSVFDEFLRQVASLPAKNDRKQSKARR